MNKKYLSCFFVLLGLSGFADAVFGRDREVELVWRPVERAVKYEIQISTSPDMDPVSFNETVQNTSVRVVLAAGVYYYRMRGVIDSGIPGPWADPEAFVVNPRPPKPVAPLADVSFGTLIPENGILFSWSKGLPGSKYVIEISDEQGVLLRRGSNKPEFSWKPDNPGNYRWKVGFESPFRTEWGMPRSFAVEKTAFPPPAAPITIVKEVVRTEIKTQVKTETVIKRVVQIKLVEDLGDPKERAAAWWVSAWLQSNLLTYSQNSPGAFSSGSGTSQNYGIGLEAIYRGQRMLDRAWTTQGSLRIDYGQMSTFDTGASYLSGALQYRLVHEGEKWKWGPLLQVGENNFPLNVIGLGSAGVAHFDASMIYPAVGLFVCFRQSRRLQANLFAIARSESGTGSNALKIAGSVGYEGALSATLFLSETMTIEPRIRLWGDHLGWTNGGASATQDLQITQFEIGIAKSY